MRMRFPAKKQFSMSDVIISVENLGKKYDILHQEERARYKTLRETLMKSAASLFHRRDELERARAREEFWALKNVSFDVERGKVLGIIGRNGAGKSTLLKVLSRITPPSEGQVILRGRVASLLEVGTGFHPELTGRENIFLNGSILGMSHVEIRRKFDEIVDFAGVEKFLDTPVKRYSSGMYVRLAFAVAAHLEPEILVVDEVLAVGDAEFQKKSMSKMQDVASSMGRTVLFVSHNMIAVQSLCEQVVLLEGGRVKNAGAAESVIASYLSESMKSNPTAIWDDPATAPGNSIVRIRGISISDANDPKCTFLEMQTEIRIETEYTVYAANEMLHITYHLLNDQGITVLTSGNKPRVHSVGSYRAACRIPGNLLNSGGYFLKLFIVQNENSAIYWKEDVASFSVAETTQRETAWMGREPGIVQPILEWSTEGPLQQTNHQEIPLVVSPARMH
jgi:lipopolysaccharide transport system ATP-binding protein